MRGVIGGILGHEEQSTSVGISSPTLQRVGGDHQVITEVVDGGLLGGSLQLPEGGEDESAKK